METDEILERARNLLEPIAAREGCELLDLRLVRHRGWTLRLTIDSPTGVGIDDCVRVSRAASARLDESEDLVRGKYVLEVSSPGIDRELFKDADYTRFAGQQVKVELHEPQGGRRRYTGTLQGLQEGEVILEVKGKQHAFPLEGIQRARLAPRITVPGPAEEAAGRTGRSRKQRGVR